LFIGEIALYSLAQALTQHDLIVLRTIGEWWDEDLVGADKTTCIKRLTQRLTQPDIINEIAYLPPEEAEALAELVKAGGRLPKGSFSRQFGEVRLMGPGWLEREEPWLDPIGPAEALWYRGLIYLAFDETAEETVEFFFVPSELYAQLATDIAATETAVPPSLPVIEAPDKIRLGRSDAVDDLTAVLATAQNSPLQADRLDWLTPLLLDPQPNRRSLLITLALEMDLLRQSEDGIRPTRAALNWLQQSREQQLRQLFDSWSNSSWNELHQTPGLICEGSSWQNDPLLARTAVLDSLPHTGEWHTVTDLINLIKSENPDFQRPTGNYDTWYIRDTASDAYITGFSNWDLVEGRLLRFLIEGPMFWLGLIDLAASGDGRFRLSDRALSWLADQPAPSDEVTVPLVVQPDASVLAPFNANRYQRFQLARISEAAAVIAGKPFVYRLTPNSLSQARAQGINPQRIIDFLTVTSGRPLPPSVRRAIERWATEGTEARLESVVILRVREAEILDKLRANSKTAPMLGESLGPLATAVRPGQWSQLRAAAAQLGLLLDEQVDDTR
jgi:hypothetical protein